MPPDGFTCRFCNERKHQEEGCEQHIYQTDVMCDCCREMFDANELCWNCYMLPYPIRLCADCLEAEEVHDEPLFV